MAKIRKSKYGFAGLELDKSFECAALDIGSMQSALSHYNKSNGTSIKIELTTINPSKVNVKRIA